MIAEIGQITLIMSLCLAALLALLPLLGTYTGQGRLITSAQPLTFALVTMLSISFTALVLTFLFDDFSVQYVAQNSNRLLPVFYKVSATWGGHEGSLLLWILILSLWTGAVALFARQLPVILYARILSVLGIIAVGFIAFSLFTSNPFLRYLPEFPLEGASLNPLLQDIGLILHPPLLYMGYVGFSVAFAFAVAALLDGKLDSAWLRWCRPWSLVAWLFLTLGIVLGSWWAYYELGWGGWWFWDPVENASFLPWLAGTALIHSLSVSEKRGLFKNWTVLLAIITFSLSLLGTFLVRSGVLTSVHAFASDPERGYFILWLLGITVGGSLSLFAWRASTVRSATGYGLLSRENFLLINNILLMIATFVVLLGTLYPLIIEAFDQGPLSVGPPYFNAIFVPLGIIIMLLLGIGTILRWKHNLLTDVMNRLRSSIAISIVFGLAFNLIFYKAFNFSVALAASLCAWIAITSFMDMKHKLRHKSWSKGIFSLPLSYLGMMLAHIGLGFTALGIAVVSNFAVDKDLRMAIGESVTVSTYEFKLMSVDDVMGPNYTSKQGIIELSKEGVIEAYIHPEKRRYIPSGQVMTEASIIANLTKDIYVAMGEELENGIWAMRIHIKPMVRFIWLGGVMMAIGGLLAAWDKRYRRKLPHVRKQAPLEGV